MSDGYPPRYGYGADRYPPQPGYPSPAPLRQHVSQAQSTEVYQAYNGSAYYDRPPPLPTRPRSAQFEHAPILPPRPYQNAAAPAANLAPPPEYHDGTYAPVNVVPSPTPPEIIAPKHMRPVSASLPTRSYWEEPPKRDPPDLPRTPSDTSSQTSDLLDASDVKILEAGIDAIPSPSHPPSAYPPLTTPIAIPQLSVRSRLLHVMPFTRANAAVAQSYGLSPMDFVRMIDTINICVAASPPFQAMHVAAAGVGVVPEPLFIGISLGLDALASAGTRITKYYRVKAFLEKINRQVWGPRGLEMRIVKDPELVGEMLGMDETRLLAEMGQQSIQEGLPEPLSAKRLRLLGDRVQPLDFDVPPPENRGNIIDKISAKNQARKAERKKSKLFKRQQRYDARAFSRKDSDASASIWSGDTSSSGHRIRSNAMEYDEYSSGSSDSDDEDIAGEEETLVKAVARAEADRLKAHARAEAELAAGGSKAAKAEARRGKELNRIEERLGRDREKVSEKREKRLGKRIKNNTKRQEKAGKRMQRMEWIVITNREDTPTAED